MKYVLLGTLCLAFAGCANTSNGGGWVVSNGMTDQDTANEGMKSLDKEVEAKSCGCAEGKSCGGQDASVSCGTKKDGKACGCGESCGCGASCHCGMKHKKK